MLNHPEWSVAPDRSPFIYGKHSRPLGLVLDDVSVDATPAVALLEAFGNRDSAHLYSTDSPRSGGRVTLRDPVRDGYVIPAELEDPSGSCQRSREFPRCDHEDSPPVIAPRRVAMASRWARMR